MARFDFWFEDDEHESGLQTDDPIGEPTVWARIEPGRTRLMPESEAKAAGYEIDDSDPDEGVWGRQSAFVRGIHMSPEERQEIFDRTGKRVDDKNGLDQVFARTGLREAEPGESCYERFDALSDCAEGHKLDERFGPSSIDLYGDFARREAKGKFNARERYEYHRQRLGMNT